MHKTTDSPLKVLYIVYWGAGEPLGQSLVLPALKKLQCLGARLTLVTFEKSEALANAALLSEIRSTLEEQSIEWIPLRYHPRPKVILDFLQGLLRLLVLGLYVRPDIVHTRTFVAGLMGLVLAPLLRTKLIFHNEGFFPDEQVDGGVWKKDSVLHRLFKFLEQQLYARADGIIALSQRAKATIKNLPSVARKNTPVIVVPSCVDLHRFPFLPVAPTNQEQEIRFVYAGSAGRRHLLDKMARFVTVAGQMVQTVRLRVLSQTEKGTVNSLLTAGGLTPGNWTCDCVSPVEIPQHLQYQHAGLLFYPQGLSEHGGSPTKVGEYWAAGLPVIATPNVSDTDAIIRREKVGVVVEAHTDEAYRRAVVELLELLADPELSQRCRQAAEKYYALDPACEQQLELYRTVFKTRNFVQPTVHEVSRP